MALPKSIEKTIEQISDWVFASIPEKTPTAEQLRSVRLIAHRGNHRDFTENTLDAFQSCADHGLWGIEFDLRWTKDNEPVILHDLNAGRVMGLSSAAPSDLSYLELRNMAPQIPHLKEVVAQFRGKIHFMIELKEPIHSHPLREQRFQEALLSQIKPGEDFHLISQEPTWLEQQSLVPHETCLSISLTNPGSISQLTLGSNLGGFTGHFVLVGQKTIHKHHALGQKVGTGFVASRNCLYREIRRGADFIFTNDPLKIQKILQNASGLDS